ncbi:bud emergence protein 1 [Apophysomyces sp. BC1034]|nr:bud emergence protein 1 [Apophysomyces sp. BC1015]KAG0175897.1 bud emergence protein 1 [Apophysomyces sp. BC1021]KAG0186479.1 bud emergence protein 1 [Apophysomyces sp. BC1034]
MFLSKEKVRPPRSLRSARRSLVKNKISTPLNLPVTNHASLAPPKKIIKALYDYQAQGPDELTFSKGDFFHVTDRENDPHWFEACNPATNVKGIVPVRFFQVLDKTERSLTAAQPESDSGFTEHDNTSATSKKAPHLYGVVLYDFQAERSDELDAKAGEPIIVIAQSNFEWFVAKPIGRLGGPGLIPVSFVEVRDAITGKPIDANEMMQRSSKLILKVEEWKKMTQGYEASSIPLGRIDKPDQQSVILPSMSAITASSSSSMSSNHSDRYIGGKTTGQSSMDGYFYYPKGNEQQHPDAMLDSYGMRHLASISQDQPQEPEEEDAIYPTSPIVRNSNSDKSIVVSAFIDSFILEGDQYWFIVYCRLTNGKFRILYRLYEDFHDFQINLLHKYPVEAGQSDRDRILPYMPGPLTEVDEEITADRQRDLNQYCKELLSLPRYLAESDLVQGLLFGIHEGDVETESDPQGDAARNSGQMAATTNLSTIKIKIVHKDDIFAIKVPADSTLDLLRTKIQERLGFEVTLRYKDETTGDSLPLDNELHMEEAFALAIEKGKLTVFAS